MAKFLLHALGLPGNPEDAYREGDVVLVREDTWSWGNREGLPTFWQIDLPGESAEIYVFLERSKMQSIGPDEYGAGISPKKRFIVIS